MWTGARGPATFRLQPRPAPPPASAPMLQPSRIATLLAALLVALAASPAAALEQDGSDRESLEAYLERARARRAERHEVLRGRVEGHLTVLQELAAKRSTRSARVREVVADIVALGSEATPLLVAHIEPGVAPSDVESFCAQQVSLALIQMPDGAIVDQLLSMLRSGSLEGRRNAARVLGHTSQPDRVRPVLREVFEKSKASLKSSALRALFHLPGEIDDALLDRVLFEEDTEMAAMALEALASSFHQGAAAKVRQLLEDPRRASNVSAGILAYYRACPDSLGSEEALALVQLAAYPNTPDSRRIEILEALSNFDVHPSSDLRAAMQPLVSHRDQEINVAAQVALTILGDRNARKALLRECDDYVDKNENWANAYSKRAAIYYRIREYSSAIKDYKKAIKLSENDPLPSEDNHVGLARCYARQNKFKDASQTLDDAPLPLKRLQALADDPAFAELREHPKYGKVFRLD